MQKLTENDLRSLKPGETVYRVLDGHYRELMFVAVLPSCKDKLIFEDGAFLVTLYIWMDGSFKGDWYKGKFDINLIHRLKVEYFQKKLDTAKVNYLKGLKKLKQNDTY